MDSRTAAERIKTALSTEDVFEFYGIRVDRSHKTFCPFHSDTRHPSMHIYPGSRGYHCFTCGASGDVISFAQNFFGLDFRSALEKLNDDFSLGLPLNSKMTVRQKREFDRLTAERRRLAAVAEQRRERLDREYWAAFDAWKAADDAVTASAPKSPSDCFTDEYAVALKAREIAAYTLDCIERSVKTQNEKEISVSAA